MALEQQSSPHAHRARPTSRVMLWVIIAAIPGLLAQTVFFGWGNLINVVWCVALALATEAAILKWRSKPVGFFLKDNTAAVTGLLLGLSLPQFAPWWVSVVAVFSAIVVAKQLYGGLGSNPFNPAMVGYALVLISFPLAMTTNWAAPVGLWQDAPGFGETLSAIASGQQTAVDGWTMATPLDEYKHKVGSHTAAEITIHPTFGNFIARGWEWVNAGFLAGGLVLLALRIISWHIPVGFLGGLVAMSLLFGTNADQYAPLSLHLLAGGTMLGAFFIATDPVSAATSHQGKLIYAVGIGALVYLIRSWGNYPDAVAFSVLLMNFSVPFIDYYTPPRTYGHHKARRGLPTRKQG
ncbi:electron transport complex subunit RsxD [Marinobacter sp. M3C]|uniref:electron transport complex subunit RsxD n=1 Tax=unclassified Marinobacter TaxID=83889 RepID=UPI00200C2863|nr:MULTISPECIES: electron transport complex subunit RsxD [unclassified Marinobacter]MCL1476902.1 electron transport complex subunit RsxD [Marinobacter sp.]MCL1482502.1 electron transport complex subunit RsxD [Marinobacter sp.]MCL1483464.1 electron transport complex subunit RsxD [Marinobacter sp.]UQG57584.1 electron transport complex subunit RsxD [Marinobacter sp. M4C]UQG61250.1 electron transport complex subunit RsxD [Marinobacter sp. M3C]